MRVLIALFALISVSFAADCGVPAIPPKQDSKIVGGVEATPHSWPWQVALYKKTFLGQYYQFCGGTLINENFVLTAGHCFYGETNTKNFKVIIGAHNLKQDEPSKIEALISGIYVNPQYNAGTTTHDTTVLKLAAPVTLNDDVSPVCLADSGADIKAGSQVYITGWGSTKEGGQTTNVLYQTSVPIVDHQKCADEYKGEQNVDETMICAAYDQGGKDTCQGDSGGPLVFNQGGKWTQYGITSWGQGCAEAGYAGVYGSVAAMRDYIDSTIAAHSK
jgi:secreted trypsin-like serine protease